MINFSGHRMPLLGFIAQLDPRLKTTKRVMMQMLRYGSFCSLDSLQYISNNVTKTAQLQPLRGFDRLNAAGFSESDIANFRRQFHSQSASNYLDTDFDTEEECRFIQAARRFSRRPYLYV